MEQPRNSKNYCGFAADEFFKLVHTVYLQGSLSDCSHSLLRPWQTRTHCCIHNVADTNVSPFACTQHFLRTQHLCPGHKHVADFVQKHFVSTTNVSQFTQPKKHHEQQCVRYNLSSFTGTVSHKDWELPNSRIWIG